MPNEPAECFAVEINVEIYNIVHIWFGIAHGDSTRESCEFSQTLYLENVRSVSDIRFYSCEFYVINFAGVRSADELRIADLFD
jgi:hypothetical protein